MMTKRMRGSLNCRGKAASCQARTNGDEATRLRFAARGRADTMNRGPAAGVPAYGSPSYPPRFQGEDMPDATQEKTGSRQLLRRQLSAVLLLEASTICPTLRRCCTLPCQPTATRRSACICTFRSAGNAANSATSASTPTRTPAMSKPTSKRSSRKSIWSASCRSSAAGASSTCTSAAARRRISARRSCAI